MIKCYLLDALFHTAMYLIELSEWMHDIIIPHIQTM